MTASQMRIAETIDAFYGDAGANDGVSRSYKQAVEDLDAETIKALDGPFRYALFECQCDEEGEGLTLFLSTKTNSPGTHHTLLCLLPRHQRM